MAQINFRIDDDTKRKADELFSSLGMTLSGAISIFLRRAIDFQGIPFEVRKNVPDIKPVSELLQRIDDVKHRRNCHYHELIPVDDEKPATKPRTKARKRIAQQNEIRRPRLTRECE